MGTGSVDLLVRDRVVARGSVARADAEGLWVAVEGRIVPCDVVEGVLASAAPLRLGEPVVILLPAEGDDRGCLLGRVERYDPAATGRKTSLHTIEADRIVLQAGEHIELRVGDSRVVIEQDGRISIEGTNVSSRARRLHRIRGAAVHIN